MLLFICALASSASAQDYKRLTNRWTGVQIHIEHGMPEAGAAEPGWWSADWIVEPVDGFVRFKNRWTNQYLHMERGALEIGAIEPGWWSAQWMPEPAEAGFVRIVNRATGAYLHVERGPLAAGAIELGWWSAQWQIGGGQGAGGQAAAASSSQTQQASAAGGGAWQGRTWRPDSQAAVSSTGVMTTTPSALLFENGTQLTVRVAQDGAPGVWDFGGQAGSATIFQVVPPEVNPVLLEGNRLCGSRPPTYVAMSLEAGSGMTISFFNGANAPAGIEQDDVCAIFAYSPAG